MELYKGIQRKNLRENLIEKNDRIVVGFSGGPDSVFLTEMLLKLREEIEFEIILVHINHLLRGEASDGDERFSLEYGKKKGLKVFSRKIDITTLGKKEGLTLEEAGREARYNLFNEIFIQEKANKIALAHNKDDQLETFMFRLVRGAGLEGLEGIVSKRDRYIRPISEIYKKDIVNYLDSNNIEYRIDKTNFENEFTRNSIRLDLIPFIEKRYNPKFKDRLYALIEEIREVNMRVNKEYIENIFKDSIEKNIFIKAIASSPVDKKSEYTKVNLKPVRIKDEIFIQFEEFKDKKAYHENICFASAMVKISDILERFKQLLISVNGADYQILKGKQDFNLKKSENTKVLKDLDHNKKKNYLIEDGTPVPFLIKLGVMGEDGKVFKNSYDKFRQINKYLEFIDDTIRELQNKKLIGDHIKFVDFGCGKSYLTFALHYYLKDIKNFTFEIIGLDLKKDVMKKCNDIAKELKCENLEFLTGNIKDFDKLQNVDIIFSLHACNNATDYALLKG